MRHTLTLHAVHCLSSSFSNSFHALVQFCPVGIWSFAHWQTRMSLSLGAAYTDSHKASASQSCRAHSSASHMQSKTYPSPKSSEPWGRSPLLPLCSKSGIMALRALTWAHPIPHYERLANGLECCLISLPKFLIMCSRVHWEEQIGGLTQITSLGRCSTEWRHGHTKWTWVALCWQ